MPVYIQQNNKGEWINENCYLAARGFRKQGYDVHAFTAKDVERPGDWLAKENVVHGKPLVVLLALQKLGAREPRFDSYPPHLRVHMDRPPTEIQVSKLAEEANQGKFKPCFLKQSRGPKVFSSLVAQQFADIADLPLDAWVWRVPAIDFISEYNLFVHKGALVAMMHSKGDPLVFPDPVKVKRILKEAKLEAVAYSLTVGVARFPERPELIRTPTILIGANDAYSLSANGLDPRLYSQMIEDRWNQMVAPVIRTLR